jgi:hypothetical protein
MEQAPCHGSIRDGFHSPSRCIDGAAAMSTQKGWTPSRMSMQKGWTHPCLVHAKWVDTLVGTHGDSVDPTLDL